MITEKTTRYAWYTEGVGQRLIEAERIQLQQLLPKMFGFHLLAVGDPALAHLVENSAIGHRIFITEGMSETWPCSLLRADGLAMPLKNDSIDTIVMPHALEQSPCPHQLLREAHRVLIPEGQLIITGLNPFSSWGLWFHVSRHIKSLPKSDHLLAASRVRGWLEFLDFKITSSQCFFFRPPITKNAIMQRIQVMEAVGAACWPGFGGGYIIVATKRVAGMTPIRPRWQVKRSWGRTVVAKPSARQKV